MKTMKTMRFVFTVAIVAFMSNLSFGQSKANISSTSGKEWEFKGTCAEFWDWVDARCSPEKAAEARKNVTCTESGKAIIIIPECAVAYIDANRPSPAAMKDIAADALNLSKKEFCVKYAIISESTTPIGRKKKE